MEPVVEAFARHWTWDDQNSLKTFFPNRYMGVLCLQHPFDAWVTQEIIWETKPDVLVECGSFMGGSACMWATYMEQYHDDPLVIAIDVEDRMSEARKLPVWDRSVHFINASTTDPATVAQAAARTEGKRTMVILDSLHTAEHVRDELAAYSDLVSPGCYLIVQDGFVDFNPEFGPGPLTATREFLAADDRFEVDEARERMMFTFNPSGFLRRA